MGVTGFDTRVLDRVISNHQVTNVIELGAQNDYSNPYNVSNIPYIKPWYEARHVHYESIDLNGENSAYVLDLSNRNILNSDLLKFKERGYDLVTDFGTSEHVGIDGKFDWRAIYNCWIIKFELAKEHNGVIISENPKVGNWPGHGFNYYTKEFYTRLVTMTDLDAIHIQEVAALGNEIDGWNILTILVKRGNRFLSFEEFQTLDLRRS